jgi:hypothetical protein
MLRPVAGDRSWFYPSGLNVEFMMRSEEKTAAND